MTNREAIKQLKLLHGFKEDVWRKERDQYTKKKYGEEVEALDLAIAALEKQEPEEPDKHVTDEKTWFCPRCHVAYKDVQPCYCHRCGQKLKWEIWQYQIEF